MSERDAPSDVASSRRRRAARDRSQNHDFVLVHAAEQRPRFLVENIGVDRLAAYQGDAAFPLHSFELQQIAFEPQLSEALLEFLAGLQPALAVDGVPDKIAADQPGETIKGQRTASERAMARKRYIAEEYPRQSINAVNAARD